MKVQTITCHQFTYLGTQRSWIGNNMHIVWERTCPTTQASRTPQPQHEEQQLRRHVRLNLSTRSLSLSLSLSLGLSLSVVLSQIHSCSCIQKLNIQLKNQINNFLQFLKQMN
jgi:hypothetical protein